MLEKLGTTIIYGAGAGTGKTSALVHELISAIRGSGRFSTPVSADGIIATTFTNAAAQELASRVRTELISVGHPLPAAHVVGGYLGTVNSICSRLVSEFGIHAGIPPIANVISEERSSVVFRSASTGALRLHAGSIRKLADRLSIEQWEETIFTVAQLARVNDIEPTRLSDCADSSWQLLKGHLDTPGMPVSAHDLMSILKAASRELSERLDGKKVTAAAIDVINKSIRSLCARGDISWQNWVQLSKLHASAALDPVLKPLREFARGHIRNPQLHDDLKEFIERVFRCAADAMIEYERYKRKRGLVDFVDQEHLCLQMLQSEAVRRLLGAQFSLLLVDEFQDTSPLQLAIFCELGRIVEQSIWVGDEKQAIFGFRGADSALMNAACEQVLRAGSGERIEQTVNFRSRPELVKLVNDVFRSSMLATGITPAFTELSPSRSSLFGPSPCIRLWRLGAGDWSQNLSALANKVKSWLDGMEEISIVDRLRGTERPPRGSDIAILCRSNERRAQVAAALARYSIPVDTERSGLMNTPEVLRAMAALRYLVDRADTVAALELVRLDSAGDWLNLLARDSVDEVVRANRYLAQLDGLRRQCRELTPREVLEIAIEYGGCVETAEVREERQQAFANLDRLRGLARQFEDRCRIDSQSSSPAALLQYLHYECSVASQPGVASPETVRVLTYHKSKGLEWPIVVLLDLQHLEESDCFGAEVTSDCEINIVHPLKGRSIRYWPWPYGAQRQDTILGERVAESVAGQSRSKQAFADRIRLLYVGMTRARDHLILATKSTPSGLRWLECLDNPSEQPLLHVGNTSTFGGHEIEVENLGRPMPYELDQAKCANFSAPSRCEVKFPPFSLCASSQKTQTTNVPLRCNWFRIGQRLTAGEGPDEAAFGSALHQYFAIVFGDDIANGARNDIAIAKDILRKFGCDEHFAEELVTASQRFEHFLKARCAKASIRCEVPVYGRLGLQRIRGYIDMLIQTDNGCIIVDHKTFPGRTAKLCQRIDKYCAQLDTYRRLLGDTGQVSVTETWIHLPILARICVVPVESLDTLGVR